MNRSGLLFKLKSIGVGGCVLSICRKFLSDRRQIIVIDGAASVWIKIVSGVPYGSVLGPLLFIIYTSEMFELVENRLLPMQMTPHCWQLFASQQTDLPLLPPLTGTRLGFKSGGVSLVHDSES